MFTAPVKHYQYRYPEQIERRLLTRRPAMEANTEFLHEMTPNWSPSIAMQGKGVNLVKPPRVAAAVPPPLDRNDRSALPPAPTAPEPPFEVENLCGWAQSGPQQRGLR
jgi:hypothetical protein